MVYHYLLPTGILFFFDTNGNIPISGLFDIHDYNEKAEKCGMINTQTGIMYLEAMLFAMDRINRNSSFLYGNKLSARLFDTCNNQQQLKRSLDYAVNYYRSQGTIGPQYSEDAILASVFLGIFQHSLVSYSAASPDLDDRKKYGNFFRTVPSYYGQIRVMIDLALRFKWTYVSFVYSSSVHEKAALYFEARALSAGICVPKFYSASEEHKEHYFLHVLKSIVKENKVKVVFIFLTNHGLNHFLSAAKSMNNEIQNLTFVGSDSWGGKESVLRKMRDVTLGSLTIQPHVKRIHEFESYFMSLNPYNNQRNPWFSEFWEHVFNCSLKNSGRNANLCSGGERIKPGLGYYQTTPVLTVINAVYTYAYVFREILKDRCISKQILGKNCVSKSHFLRGSSNLRDIRDILQIIQFKEPFGNCTFSLSHGKGVLQHYDILNVKLGNYSHQYYYEVVGHWMDAGDTTCVVATKYKNNTMSSSLALQSHRIVWRNGNDIPPNSACSDECPHRYYRIYQDPSKCCWKCEQCGFNSYVFNNTCISCELDYIPDSYSHKCVPLPIKYLDFTNLIAASIMSLCCIGLFSSFAVIAMFIKKFDHPVIKASGRELCLNMLVGIMMTYMAPIVLLLEPTVIVCLTQKVIISIGLTFTFAPLALKLNRIYRIFQCSKRLKLRPSAVSAKSQIIISLVISLVGILISVISVKDDPPKIHHEHPAHRKHVVKHCAMNPSTLAINLAYSSALMIISTWYAFKTRHFPENFNETKYIGFTMYTTCLLLCASLPPFFMINDTGNSRIFIMCFVCEAIATINLVGLFFPKLVKVQQQNFSDQNFRMSKSGSTTSSTFQLSRENSIRSISTSAI